jgi:hypothetical protein
METKVYGRFENTGVVINYSRNISNDVENPNATITTTGGGTPDVLPMFNDGDNDFEFRTVTESFEVLDFDETFNSNQGGIISNRAKRDTEYFTRITVTNQGGTAGTVSFQNFLVFDKSIPGTGISIDSSEQTLSPGAEAAHNTKFFGGGIEAIYPRISTSVSRPMLMRGLDITASENQ